MWVHLPCHPWQNSGTNSNQPTSAVTIALCAKCRHKLAELKSPSGAPPPAIPSPGDTASLPLELESAEDDGLDRVGSGPRAHVSQEVAAIFEEVDTNADGLVSHDELMIHLLGRGMNEVPCPETW